MSKTKELQATNGQKEKHKLPKSLADRLKAERDAANARIQQVDNDYRRTVGLLIDGYSAALGENKIMILSNDLEYLIEQ